MSIPYAAVKVARKERSGLASSDIPSWREAFRPDEDFRATGDVDHVSRTVSARLQRDWETFADDYQTGITQADLQAMMKDFDWRTGELYGYLRTTNSFAINQQLYNPNNDGKTDAQIFRMRDRKGALRDLQTVQTLDRAISQHTTKNNATYTRYCSPAALQATFGLDNAQIQALQNAGSLTVAQMRKLNAVFSGKTSYSKAYTSTSANKSMNAFRDPTARQSRGYIFERRLYVPSGTNAYAASTNAQESEVIFGRKMQTRIMKITVSNNGHIVIHEMFENYRKH